MLIVPPALRPGDTIAIIPTARAITLEELREGIALAESWGLRVQLGKCIGRKHFQQAGTDEERSADLQAAIDDPQVKAIWCARGGYGTARLLGNLDLTPLRTAPKWIIGFSDVTVLHNALSNMGVASLHAQMPFNIKGKTQACTASLKEALFSTGTQRSRIVADHSPGNRYGQAASKLTGGNLSILQSLRGTPYDIDPAGKILFLEDLDELLYHLDRMVQNLRLSGWFGQLAGLVVGGMTEMRNKNEEDPFGSTAEKIITRALSGTSYPVCFHFPAGHIDDNRALIMGAQARLDVGPKGTTLEFVVA